MSGHMSIFLITYFYFMCSGVLPARMSVRVLLNPLELELKRVVSCHVGAGIKPLRATSVLIC